jgi:uncharacterized membrane protein YqaE (UPF0057 family)
MGSDDETDIKIQNNKYTLFDKIMYGGLGYGNVCIPKNLFRIIFTVIFPPLGVFLKYTKKDFPYIDFKGLYMNFYKIIVCVILTGLFYVPGLMYAMDQMKCDKKEDKTT